MWEDFLITANVVEKGEDILTESIQHLRNLVSSYTTSACANELLVLVRGLPTNTDVIYIYIYNN